MALNLAVKATGLGHYLNGDLHDFPILNNNKNWFSTPVLTRLAETISAAKRFLAWLDRYIQHSTPPCINNVSLKSLSVVFFAYDLNIYLLRVVIDELHNARMYVYLSIKFKHF